jgi:hypothetical protein
VQRGYVAARAGLNNNSGASSGSVAHDPLGGQKTQLIKAPWSKQESTGRKQLGEVRDDEEDVEQIQLFGQETFIGANSDKRCLALNDDCEESAEESLMKRQDSEGSIDPTASSEQFI